MPRRRYRSKQQFWRAAFRRVMNYYLEAKSAAYSSSVGGFYAAMEAETKGSGYVARIIKPTLIDYVCDVEIVARGVLNPSQYQLFRILYIDLKEPSPEVAKSDRFRKAEKKIKEQVGKAFVAFKIYPAESYFASKDLR